MSDPLSEIERLVDLLKAQEAARQKEAEADPQAETNRLLRLLCDKVDGLQKSIDVRPLSPYAPYQPAKVTPWKYPGPQIMGGMTGMLDNERYRLQYMNPNGHVQNVGMAHWHTYAHGMEWQA